ncbi:MAG: DUF6141 family protein [Actinomycetota bacterium]
MAGGEEATFREVQRFNQPWLWALVALAAAFAWFAFFYELFSSLTGDDGGADLWVAVLVWVVVGLGVPVLFIACKLVVEVRRDGLYYRYHPFHRRTYRIAWQEITSAEARSYRPIAEYGGWGLRRAWRKDGGMAYNVYGNRGLQLVLTDGKRVLFGSQRADELAAAVRKGMRG